MAEPSRVRTLLVKELLRVRDLAGLSGREMARRLGISQPKMSRIDRGLSLPSMPLVERWLAEGNANEDTRERILALAEAAHGETRPWGDLLDGRDHLQDEARERTAAARLIRNFQPTVIPGLLQTAEYTRSVLALGKTTDRAAALAARLERQQVLHEPGRRFEFVISEQVLRWAPGPQALAGQIDRLLSLMTLESVEVAVLESSAAVVVPWHNFIIREPADGSPSYVTTELFHGAQKINDTDSVAVYLKAWKQLWQAAVTADKATALLRAALPGR